MALHNIVSVWPNILPDATLLDRVFNFIAYIMMKFLFPYKDIEGVAVPMLFLPKGVADKMDKTKIQNSMLIFLACKVVIKQSRTLYGKFVLTFIRP